MMLVYNISLENYRLLCEELVMPIYEYQCLICGTHFEKRQSFSDEPRADCPDGHKETRRLLGAPVVLFKGSGFYVTDNRNSRNGANAGKKSESKSETKSESKSETTTSEKSE
jgi:putative FmdB family regulatory protein